MAKKIFLTGISGFIGKEIAIEALSRGYSVHGTIRFRDDEQRVRKTLSEAMGTSDIPVTIERLELGLPSGWAKAMRGCNIVIHTAAHVPVVFPRNRAELFGAAIDGTKTVMQAAKRNEIERVILTSSSTAITEGHRFRGKRIFDETDWSDLNGRRMTAYATAKTLAEKGAWSAAQANDCPFKLTTIQPGVTMGPIRDLESVSSIAILTRMLKGVDPAQPNFGFPYVHVFDVARCHVDAITNDNTKGERIAATNGFMWYPEVASFVQEEFPELGLKSRRFPSALVRVLSPFKPRLRTFEPHLDRHADVSNAKALSIFGRPFIPLDDMLRQTVRSLIEKSDTLLKKS
ncbi:MAG: NAD-dependent epimerase/dehydratase family protein [Pseudomonadota bacterium]